MRIYANIHEEYTIYELSVQAQYASLDPNSLNGEIYYIDIKEHDATCLDLWGDGGSCFDTNWRPYTCTVDRVKWGYYHDRYYDQHEINEDLIDYSEWVEVHQEYKDGELVREFYTNDYGKKID